MKHGRSFAILMKKAFQTLKFSRLLMEAYLGGLIQCGFVINGYVECQMDDITELMFMTRVVKL